MRYILILLTLLLGFLWAEDYKTITRATYKKMKTEPKVALVIGNQDYEEDSLKHTISDAKKMKVFLESKGFVVIYAKNVKSKGAIRKLMNKFLVKIEKNGVGLFYFSGHGMSAYNKNYLIPIENSSIAEDTDIEEVGISVNYLLEKLENKKNRLNIVILDACRNTLDKGGDGAIFNDNATGVYIAYATAFGKKARDNGVFTSSFVKNASITGLKIEEVFKNVRIEVDRETEGKQVPFTSSGLKGDFFFTLPKEGSPIINNVIYNEVKSDNKLIWILGGGVFVLVLFLLFLLLKPKGNGSSGGKEEPPPPPPPEKIKGIIKMNKLIYQNQPFIKQYTWQEAKEYAKNLRLGDFDDWRLPTRDELRVLGNIKFYDEYDVFWEEWYQNHKDSALVNSKGAKHFIDERLLKNMPKDSWFWTSEAKNEDDIWRVGFHLGCSDVCYDEDMSYVLCVRDEKEGNV